MHQQACLLASKYGHDCSAYCCILVAVWSGHKTSFFLRKVIRVFSTLLFIFINLLGNLCFRGTYFSIKYVYVIGLWILSYMWKT